jgi:putative DNA methylase
MTESQGSAMRRVRRLSFRARPKMATEALAYNSLVQSWPEITRLAREGALLRSAQVTMFEGTGEGSDS